MEDIQEQKLGIKLIDSSQVNPEITAAVKRVKSFSPGAVYEFLQSRFPLQALKSKAHAKTASALISVLHGLLDNADLEKSEIIQIRTYEKTLQSFVTEYEGQLAKEIKAQAGSELRAAGKSFSGSLINRLKETAEAERRSMFGGISKAAKSTEVLEAKFKKVKTRYR